MHRGVVTIEGSTDPRQGCVRILAADQHGDSARMRYARFAASSYQLVARYAKDFACGFLNIGYRKEWQKRLEFSALAVS
jgi:hypothetical protein